MMSKQPQHLNDIVVRNDETSRTEGLIRAALERAQRVETKIRQAVRDIDAEGGRVDFATVARRAQVSRQSIYSRPSIRDEILALRDAYNQGPSTKRPVKERASEDSVRARNYILLDENKRLKTEIASLRKRLEELLGEKRRATIDGEKIRNRPTFLIRRGSSE